MFKKLITAGAVAATMLMLAGGAWAWGGSWNVAFVKNGSEAVANTGENMQLGGQINVAKGSGEAEVEGNSVDQRMRTGDADADSTAVVVANTHVGCGCGRRGKDIALVGNESYAGANTGFNTQVGGQYNKAKSWGGGEAEVEDNSVDQRMSTGDADADSSAWVVVNTHVGF